MKIFAEKWLKNSLKMSKIFYFNFEYNMSKIDFIHAGSPSVMYFNLIQITLIQID